MHPCAPSWPPHAYVSTRRHREQGEAPGSHSRARLPLARMTRYPGGCASESRGTGMSRQRDLGTALGTTWGHPPPILGMIGG
jgi:hypothetical protein